MFVVFVVVDASLSTSVTVFGKEDANQGGLCMGYIVRISRVAVRNVWVSEQRS